MYECLRGDVVSRKWSKLSVCGFGFEKFGSEVEFVVQQKILFTTG